MFTLYQYTDVTEGTCNLVERVGDGGREQGGAAVRRGGTIT